MPKDKIKKKHNMKKLSILIFIVLYSLSAMGQQGKSFVHVDFKTIKEEVNSHPEDIATLIESVAKLDTTLSVEKIAMAYFCSSYSQNYLKASNMERALYDLRNKKDYEKLLLKSNEVLRMNPLNCTALNTAMYACIALKKTDNEKDYYTKRLSNILYAISRTGDGSKEYPFYVTSVPDEYLLMQYWFNLWEYKQQSLIKNCDKIDLKKTSELYSNKEIYFEITRVLEIENAMFSK